MQERHQNRKQYFVEQGITTREYVIPYIETVKPVNRDSRILEIGCGEGGNLSPFLEMNCEVVGVDINTAQIERARLFTNEQVPDAKLTLLNRNIYELGPDDLGVFDLIMLRDVIEHIPDQDKFFKHLKTLLKPDGVVFFGFPPWYMPFGGHQQICHSKLSKVPYFHLLPEGLYRFVLKSFGEQKSTIDSLIEIKETGISINRFNKLVASNGYQFAKKTYYLINPNYKIKFGLTPRKQNRIVQSIPFFRDFFTTCYYSVVRVGNPH
jgi:SAM-dependent methyltransferase